MQKLIDLILNRHRDWRAFGSTGTMRRWTGQAWESRPMTQAERDEAEWWLATR